MRKTKENRTSVINIRVTNKQKEKARKDANALDMTVSKYISQLIDHPNIVILPGGKELARELYRLNLRLEEMERYPVLPVEHLRAILGESMERIHAAWNEKM